MAAVKLGPESVVVVAPDQVSTDLADEAVILNLRDATYYGLNALGARIWNLVQKPTTLREIKQQLLAEYEVQPQVLDKDVRAFLQRLAQAGLIEVHDGKSA
jgi:hypothetical protein